MKRRAMLVSWAAALLIGGLVIAAETKEKKESPSSSKWESVKTTAGKIDTTTHQTGGGNNNNRNNGKYANTSNYRVVPVYFEFDTTSGPMRIKYEVTKTGDRPDLRIEVEKEITKPNGDKDWQRVGLVGRARGDSSGGNQFDVAPGRFRLELTGQNSQYSITIEQRIKPEAPAKSDKK